MTIERAQIFNFKISETERAQLQALADDEDAPAATVVRKWIRQRHEARFGSAAPATRVAGSQPDLSGLHGNILACLPELPNRVEYDGRLAEEFIRNGVPNKAPIARLLNELRRAGHATKTVSGYAMTDSGRIALKKADTPPRRSEVVLVNSIPAGVKDGAR